MVMSFFKKSENGLEVIAHRTITMLADARHSFDLASAAVLSGAETETVAQSHFALSSPSNSRFL